MEPSKPITEIAKHPGHCVVCGLSILTGDVIVQEHLPGGTPVAAHAECHPDFKVGGSQ